MILFESIRWKNFLSTGDQWTEIDLQSHNSTLIVGTNGAGKSTLLDALCFAGVNSTKVLVWGLKSAKPRFL